MTNREYMIELLQNPSHDEAYEDMIYRNVACAYGENPERGECYGKSCGSINRDMCVRCKEKWLDSEVE